MGDKVREYFAWRKWRLGATVSILLSLFVAGAGVVEGTTWRQFVAVFCAAALTHFGAFLARHPVEEVSFDDEDYRKEDEKVNS